MIRCGADPESIDKEGISLLTVMMGLGSPNRTKELVALTQITSFERKYYTPKLMDYLVCEEGIMQLVDDLQKNELSTQNILRLAKFPLAKERVIEYIKSLNADNKEAILKETLKPKSALNQFFSVPRDWFMTSNQRGTLAQLISMQRELIKNRISELREEDETTNTNKQQHPQLTSMRRIVHLS